MPARSITIQITPEQYEPVKQRAYELGCDPFAVIGELDVTTGSLEFLVLTGAQGREVGTLLRALREAEVASTNAHEDKAEEEKQDNAEDHTGNR